MSLGSLLKKPSAFIPLVLSGIALVIVVVASTVLGAARRQDEGAAAHLFQMLIVLQVPIALYFAYCWFPNYPRQTVLVAVLQIAAAALACAPVLILGL